jgi:hypothetical protein
MFAESKALPRVEARSKRRRRRGSFAAAAEVEEEEDEATCESKRARASAREDWKIPFPVALAGLVLVVVGRAEPVRTGSSHGMRRRAEEEVVGDWAR